jgi:hypothetical protein
MPTRARLKCRDRAPCAFHYETSFQSGTWGAVAVADLPAGFIVNPRFRRGTGLRDVAGAFRADFARFAFGMAAALYVGR